MQKTPTQQALIQFIESILITALIAGVVSISPLVVGANTINLNQILVNFGLAVAFSLAHSLATYLKALPAPQQGAPISTAELGSVLDNFITVIQQRLDALYAPSQQPIAQQSVAQMAQPTPPQGGSVIAAPPVHGPAGVVAANVQPAQSAVQTNIPAFTSTAEIAAVQANQPQQ